MVNNFYVKNLIESWGSIGQFAKEIGCSYEAARKMRDRNSISPKYWNIIIQLSESKGPPWVTLDWFLHMYENKSHGVSLLITEKRKSTISLTEKFTTSNGAICMNNSTDNNKHPQHNSQA
ncbi:hypothetical protein [Bartonella tribocorum]|uniref:DNA-binding protein n=1 Tax=Bartonella tribocorum (strain DSM 28219 / CCUG 45778 / CIP 105476 / IBS 506) TaxID=382640 RepID=A9IT12_BART1|nr:hypothetical protein [Bartonella tribocorum]CAK01367.1 hypothetical protein BT_0970b [Bartonella tribocorum CIP 105476]CDO48592.1 hypothetical DNA-binding protein [Bartonella tribocorum]